MTTEQIISKRPYIRCITYARQLEASTVIEKKVSLIEMFLTFNYVSYPIMEITKNDRDFRMIVCDNAMFVNSELLNTKMLI
ncbi:MAG TPA: hypothetical protein DCE52_16100 [Rhodobacteraceae bacterium]|nr:hypothetical protein [Paracoccaceae bacterium]